MKIIREFQRKFRFLSNFYLVPIEYEGMIYPSVEHAYQSSKTDDPEERRHIAQMKNAGNVKKYAKKFQRSEDWENKKVRIMKELVKQKFEVPYLRTWLDDTKGSILQEGNLWRDEFWGVNLANGKGQNWLGKILMEIRDGIVPDE